MSTDSQFHDMNTVLNSEMFSRWPLCPLAYNNIDSVARILCQPSVIFQLEMWWWQGEMSGQGQEDLGRVCER